MKRKILFLESRFNSFYGAQKSMVKLIKSLDSEKFEPTVVTTENGMLSKNLRKENIPFTILKIGQESNVFGGKVLKYSVFKKMTVGFQILVYNIKLIKYIRKNNIDIVYVNDLRALIYSILSTKLLRKKNVWYIRSDISNSLLTNISLRLSTNIITIANGVLRHIPKSVIDSHAEKITNIYTGFSFNEGETNDKNISKQKLKLPKDKLLVGYLGSINERKGLDFLIHSFKDLKSDSNEPNLLVVGDTSPGYESQWEALKKTAKENGDFLIHLPYSNEIEKIYSAIDIFVLPSRSEGLPRVAIEAMSYKVPVIVTDVGGAKEIVDDNIDGLVIEKDNKVELINALEILLKDQNKRLEFGSRGFQKVNNKFSEKEFVQKVNNYFREI
ncbi:glycosyltransferase family 4 protein [Planococcus maritimus]|uniref:glycosyltransferase family 4 protein n=1 Tax=Planococcus maritimus TaxID=192421 RepID=UPI000796497F|nr:glycosyltransferase family 4 protein [Planococcus maritimus]KYG59431.1 hypothetical protein AY633_04090 [Planococcus maritimus]